MAKISKITKTPKTPKAPTVEIDEDEIDEDEDDLDAAPATSGRNWQKTQRLAPAQRESVLLANLRAKVSRRALEIAAWPIDAAATAHDDLALAAEALDRAARVLAAIPADFRPRKRGPKPHPEIAAGSIVEIAPRRREDYAGVLTDADLWVGMEVREVRGNRVIAVLRNGMVAMFPRGHVRAAV